MQRAAMSGYGGRRIRWGLLILIGVAPLGCDLQSLEATTLQGHTEGVTALSFSPDGGSLVSGGKDGRVIIWDTKAGTVERTYLPYDGYLEFSGRGDPPGHRGGFVLRTVGGRKVAPPPDVSIRWAGLSSDGQQVISVGRQVVVWDRASGKELSRFDLGPPRSLKCDGRVILVRSPAQERRSWRVWSVKAQRVLLEFDASSATLSPPSAPSSLVAYVHDDVVTVRGVPESDSVQQLEGVADLIRATAFSRDGRFFAALDRRGNVLVWDVKTGQTEMSVSIYEGTQQQQKGIALGSLVFSDSGMYLAASDGRKVAAIDVGSGQVIGSLRTDSSVTHVLACLEGKGVVTLQQHHALRDVIELWDLRTGRRLDQASHSDKVTAVALKQDMLATGSSMTKYFENTTIKLWWLREAR